MSKEKQKKVTLTLSDIISKNKQMNKGFRGKHFLETYGADFYFKKCEEDFFFDLTDKYPDVFSDEKDASMSEYMKAMHRLLYECLLAKVDETYLSLKDKGVQEALGLHPAEPDKMIDNTVKKFLPKFEDRTEMFSEILKFSGFGGNSKKNIAEKTKN